MSCYKLEWRGLGETEQIQVMGCIEEYKKWIEHDDGRVVMMVVVVVIVAVAVVMMMMVVVVIVAVAVVMMMMVAVVMMLSIKTKHSFVQQCDL